MYKPKTDVATIAYFNTSLFSRYLLIVVLVIYSLLKMAAEKGVWRNREWSKSGRLSLLTFFFFSVLVIFHVVMGGYEYIFANVVSIPWLLFQLQLLLLNKTCGLKQSHHSYIIYNTS